MDQSNNPGTLTRFNSATGYFQSFYGGSNTEKFRAVDALNELEYIAAGFSNSNNGHVSGNHGDYDFWVVKFSTLNKIKGHVYVDANGNGTKDASENYFTNVNHRCLYFATGKWKNETVIRS